MSVRTVTDLARLPGWELIDNFHVRHGATRTHVVRDAGARPWKVWQGSVATRRSFKHEDKACWAAQDTVFDIEQAQKVARDGNFNSPRTSY